MGGSDAGDPVRARAAMDGGSAEEKGQEQGRQEGAARTKGVRKRDAEVEKLCQMLASGDDGGCRR